MATHPIEARFLDVRRSPVMALARRVSIPLPAQFKADALLATIMLAAACSGVSLSLVGALNTAMANDLSIPVGFEGLIQSSFFVGCIAASIAFAAMARRGGTRHAGLGAITLGIVGALLTGTPMFWLVVAGRFLSGVGLAGTVLFCGAIFMHSFPKRQASLLTLFHAVVAAAATLGLYFARPLAGALGDWGSAFWVVGLVSLIPLVAFASTPMPAFSAADSTNEPKPASPLDRFAAPRLTLTDILRNQSFLATAAVMIAYVAAEQACTLFIATLAETSLGWSATGAAELAALFWLGIILSRVASATFERWLSRDKQVTMGAAVMGAAIVMLALIPVPELVIPWVFLAGFAGGPIVPLATSRCVEMVDEKSKSLVLSTCNIACCLGGVLGPLMVSMIAEERTLGDGFWLVGGIMVAAVGLVHRSDAKA